MTTPSFLPEIALQIIDFLASDYLSLNSTSLVCKAWQSHSQKYLFETFNVTIPSENTAARLEEFHLSSSTRIRDYVKHLILTFPSFLPPLYEEWIRSHEKLLADALRILPLQRLTSFTLHNGWVPFRTKSGELDTFFFLHLPSCMDEITASPMLDELILRGPTPLALLLRHCQPSLKSLYASFTPTWVPREHNDYSTLTRRAVIQLETLSIRCTGGSSRDLTRYILDPRSLIGVSHLQSLQAEDASLDNDDPLYSLLDTCLPSLNQFGLGLSVPPSPSESRRLGLMKARNVKWFYFYINAMLDHAKLSDLMDWLLGEFAGDASDEGDNDQDQLPSLVTLWIHFGVFAIADLDLAKAASFAQALANESRFPKIKDVNIRFTISNKTQITEETIIEHEVELGRAMSALKDKGVLNISRE